MTQEQVNRLFKLLSSIDDSLKQLVAAKKFENLYMKILSNGSYDAFVSKSKKTKRNKHKPPGATYMDGKHELV